MADATYEEIGALDQEIEALKRKRAELFQKLPREDVSDYEFERIGGKVRLSELFAGRDDLLLIHNMGGHCAYCTLWADGIQGQKAHLESRAALVLVSNDEAEEAARFAASRGWTFPVVSGRNSTFTADMGFYFEGQGVYPGVSAFRKDADGKIHRVSRAFFGPGDDFCPAFHFFDLLECGAKDWEPQLQY